MMELSLVDFMIVFACIIIAVFLVGYIIGGRQNSHTQSSVDKVTGKIGPVEVQVELENKKEEKL